MVYNLQETTKLMNRLHIYICIPNQNIPAPINSIQFHNQFPIYSALLYYYYGIPPNSP